MRIALMYGKGRDGCGAQTYGTETIKWARKAGHDIDLYSLEERAFIRAKLNPIEGFIGFKASECKEIAEKLERYDVVVYHTFPSNMHLKSTINLFYNTIMKIKKPIKVVYQHDLNFCSINKVPYVLPILNEADIIYTFSPDTDYSKRVSTILKSKNRGDRIRAFSMILDYSAVEKYRRPIAELQPELTYVGRWSNMKGSVRVCDLADRLWANGINPQMIGLERSIGMKVVLLDHPGEPVHMHIMKPEQQTAALKRVKELHAEKKHVPIMGEYNFDWAFKNVVSKSMFACSFYRMPRTPTEYFNRMEFTQIEMIAAGCVPVFDKHWGEHNYTKAGDRYIDTPYSAVYSDEFNLDTTVEQLVNIKNTPALIEKYRETSLALVKNEYCAEESMPALFEDILRIGKDKNKYTSIDAMLDDNNAFNLSDYYKTEKEHIVSLGFNDIERDETKYLDNKRKVNAKHIANSLGAFC